MEVSKELKENYSGYYDSGESKWRRICSVDKVNNISRLCKSYPHAKILEVGSGEGSILQRLSKTGFGKEYYSLEISKSGVDVIKKRNIPELKSCKLYDGYTIPYKDKEFDLVILSHVVEHLEHPRKLLNEARRVGKFVFVEVPLELNKRLKKNFAFDKVGHLNFYSPKSIRFLLQTCNFDILDQFTNNISFDAYKHLFGKLAVPRYLLKESLLKLSPDLAVDLWTYHCSLLCKDKVIK